VLAVLGATGYTGRLVLRHARELGLPLRLVGRRRDALEAAAREGEQVRVADAHDDAALRDALAGATVVASTAGPFLEVGYAPVEAALAVGAHYLDTTGEQAYARRVYEQYGPRAREAGLVLLTQFGFDYVPGDLAARLAAEGLEEPLDGVAVAYAVASVSPTRGTLRSAARILRSEIVAFADGRLVPTRVGATARRFRFPFGERLLVEWGGGEALTVPRHTRAREVRTYVRAPRLAARAGRLLPAASPLLELAARVRPDPSEARRRAARFTVVAEAWNRSRGRRVTLAGADVYDLTGLLVARGAEALLRGEARAAGALAPAEAFDAHALVERLAPRLELAGTDEL
jgi:short subunit dehydrogenase-like uncharacterized protein